MDGIASNSFQMKMDRSNHHRVAQVEESDAMKTMIMTLMEKFDAFSSSLPRETLPPLVQEQQGVKEVNFMGKQNFQGGNYHQGKPNFQGYNATSNFQGDSSSYNPNFKHHENFSYANQKAAVQFPPGFNPGGKPPNNEGRPSQDEVMETMFKKMEEFMKNTSGQIKTLEHQGKFLSTTETNPIEHCKAIQLRSGTSYEGPRKPLEHDDNVSEKDEDEERTPSRENEEEKGMMKNEEKEEEELELAKEDEEDKSMGTEREKKKEQEEMKKKQEKEDPLKDPGDSKEEKGSKKGALKQTLKLEQNASLRGFDMKKKTMTLLCSREDVERKKKSSKELKSEKGFEVGDEVVWHSSKLKGILGHMKLKRRGILIVKKVHHGGTLEVENGDGDLFITNGNHVKLFHPTVPKEVPNIELEREREFGVDAHLEENGKSGAQ
ncbi:hypothetical protein ACS0TY_017275 [Phlomoides rotata]